MRAQWRDARNALTSHADWWDRIDAKNRVKGTSAPTLAEAWAGPVELFSALRHQERFNGLRIEEIVVEAQSVVDEYSGPRNHDLVVRGSLPDSDRVVVCVEAKAGEALGRTVAEQARAADSAKTKAEAEGPHRTSNTPARLRGLLERFVNHPPDAPRVQELRYQLLTALAGTISEAQAYGARHGVLMVHDFLTDKRDRPDVISEHDRDLRNFCTTVFDLEPPAHGQEPWCISLGTVPDTPDVALYLARAVTDLRTETLKRR